MTCPARRTRSARGTAPGAALVFAALLAPLPAPGGGQDAAPPRPETRRPHVLFISVDDLNDWVGPLGGHPLARTPNFDRLAARGVAFLNAHCQAPLCNPSRTSVLTGLRPTTTGVYALEPWFRSSPALQDRVTLPQHFSRHGYRTITTGKIWHDAYPPAAAREDGSEFDVWGTQGGFRPLPDRKLVDTPSEMRLVDWGIYPEKDEETFDWNVTSYAVSQLSQWKDGPPVLLCVGLRHPHLPCFAPGPWFDLYPDDDSVLPALLPGDRSDVPAFAWRLHWKLPEPRLTWLQENQQWQPLARAYLASVSFADAMLGRILDALSANDLEDDTLVVLWSDHGWHLGEKDISGKNTLWERSTRVPLFITGPGLPQGAVCRQPVELLDLFPTLIDLCGLPAPAQPLEGHSLTSLLLDGPDASRPWPAITSHGPGNHAIRTRTHRLIRYADGSRELYDLSTDPHEWRNLLPGGEDLAAELERWIPPHPADPLPGSRSRLIEVRDGTVYWEGEPVSPESPPPQD
ncbi:MAG TPA: sulfatase [Verrucomicrobiales bacterium]|nr:sulfatase [Verrucomicrobiales bacterium]